MRLMQLVGFRRLLPKTLRETLRPKWNQVLAWEHYRHERNFYRQFIQRGDLVFDVGANVGGKTAAFLSLGARVVAVEPNPVCVELIRRNYNKAIRNSQLHLEPLAVASRVGEVSLTIFELNHEMSSGSSEFVRYAQNISNDSAREFMVKSITLDDLVSRYGLPDFLKVDVEGMDADALRGLSQRPRLLSFEYHTAAAVWENTCECFNQAVRLGFTEANFTEMANPKLLFRDWRKIEQARLQVQEWRNFGERWGDVLVR